MNFKFLFLPEIQPQDLSPKSKHISAKEVKDNIGEEDPSKLNLFKLSKVPFCCSQRHCSYNNCVNIFSLKFSFKYKLSYFDIMRNLFTFIN